MTLRLRFLLDTNVLIPLQDSYQILEANLANFIRLAGAGGHQILYHPATVSDFQRDPDRDRRERNLQRLKQYSALDHPAPCPWNSSAVSANEACDNEILYALECDAVHALVTEDRGMHAKAKVRGLAGRIYTIQTAEDWLRRLHQPRQIELPNIEDVPMHSLTPALETDFFDSLRDGYPGFEDWFRKKAREDRRAWTYRREGEALGALCVYHPQVDEPITDTGDRLNGRALKLCTFKVAEPVRGHKIGELFLKAAFRYASDNGCENIFIHANAARHEYLIQLLEDFGFSAHGTYNGDSVLVKPHPIKPPSTLELTPLEYSKRFFPHFRQDQQVQKFLIPIQPQFHEALFPDYGLQSRLFSLGNVGNAIKLAYLCHSQTKSLKIGDIVLFYRTTDEMSVTSIGIVDRFEVLSDASKIAGLVSRRTVYSHSEIEAMACRATKVILFRLTGHLPRPVSYSELLASHVVQGPIQSILKLQNNAFSKVLEIAQFK